MEIKMSMHEENLLEIKSVLPISYIHLNKSSDKPLLLFFHGYQDSAKSFLKRAYPDLDEKFEVLAINGLFPTPERRSNEWRRAYAWYFADFSKKTMLRHPDISVGAVKQLLEHLQLHKRPKILIGFSQGGFFIPYLLPELRQVKAIVTVGAAYREEDYSASVQIPFDAIHGNKDEIITLEAARSSFENFVSKKCPQGKFHEIADLAHTMNTEARNLLKEKINQVFK